VCQTFQELFSLNAINTIGNDLSERQSQIAFFIALLWPTIMVSGARTCIHSNQVVNNHVKFVVSSFNKKTQYNNIDWLYDGSLQQKEQNTYHIYLLSKWCQKLWLCRNIYKHPYILHLLKTHFVTDFHHPHHCIIKLIVLLLHIFSQSIFV